MKLRRMAVLSVAALFIFSTAGISVGGDFPRGGGGFLIGRIAAKRLKKMREKEHFNGADQDKDGKLDKKEVEDSKKTHELNIDDETFKKIDTDNDGKLSHEECEKYHQEMEKAEKKDSESKSAEQEKPAQK